jgi:hypothetical protein
VAHRPTCQCPRPLLWRRSRITHERHSWAVVGRSPPASRAGTVPHLLAAWRSPGPPPLLLHTAIPLKKSRPPPEPPFRCFSPPGETPSPPKHLPLRPSTSCPLPAIGELPSTVDLEPPPPPAPLFGERCLRASSDRLILPLTSRWAPRRCRCLQPLSPLTGDHH